jgi:hypothetical protein
MVTGCRQVAPFHPSNGGKSHADCSILPSYGPYCRHSAKCLLYVGGLDYTATFTIQQQPADIHPSNGGKSHADCSILPSYGPYSRHSAICLLYVGGLDHTATLQSVRMVTGCRQVAPFHPSNGGCTTDGMTAECRLTDTLLLHFLAECWQNGPYDGRMEQPADIHNHTGHNASPNGG